MTAGKKPTHQQLFEELIYDENIQDNITVSNNYEEDELGNSIITMGFVGVGTKRKKGSQGFVVFTFNKKGRMVNMEIATKEASARKWQIAISEVFVDMTPRFGDEKFNSGPDRKKVGN